MVKHSFGVKEMPLTSTEPAQEVPDALHLDINVSQHLITIACRIYHYGGKINPSFQYSKTDLHKKDIERSESKYFNKLREQITSLPEVTQFPGNFAREYCDMKNAAFISDPLPDCAEKVTWMRLMTLWRSMRQIHKSNSDPTLEQIELFEVMALEFQKKLYSFKWVPPANQVARLSHLAYFMQAREVRSIGAFSLEGLEHGNFTTKYLESTRVWKGDSKVGNKQLFRLLRWQGSPTMRRAAKLLEGVKRKPDKCSKCHEIGHKKSMRICPLFDDDGEELSSESDATADSDQSVRGEDEFSYSDEESNIDGSQTAEDTAEESNIEDSQTEEDTAEEDESGGGTEVDEDNEAEEATLRRRMDHNERLIRDSENECGTS